MILTGCSEREETLRSGSPNPQFTNRSQATCHVACTTYGLERYVDGLDNVQDLEEARQDERGAYHQYEFELVEKSSQ